MGLTIVRHTRVGIDLSLCYGQSDVPLADTYPEEWAETVSRLGDLSRFERVYSSPLRRCLSFANEYFGEDVETDPRLMEINFGDWEGIPWSEIFESSEGKAWFEDYLHQKPPHGESYPEMVARVKAFYEEKVAGREEEILLVTHSGVLRCFLDFLKGYTPMEAMEAEVDYGEVLKLED